MPCPKKSIRNTKNSHDIQTKRTRRAVSLQRDIKTNTKNIATQCQVGIKTKIPHRALWGIALKNVFYFTKTFLPLMIYNPLLEVFTFLPCKS